MAESKKPVEKPEPAPKSQYGPSFDDIERRDPVQWMIAKRAYDLERLVQQEMVKVYRERMEACYIDQRDNFPQTCKKFIMDYWKAFQAYKKVEYSCDSAPTNRFRVPLEEYYREVEEMYANKYGDAKEE